MRIESLIIDNYRQYRHAEYNFVKTNNANDMHIVLGSNGVGKTNMLNSITWCLYGKELHLGDKNTAAPMLNNKYVDKLRQNGISNGNLKVAIILSSDEDAISKIKVTRNALFKVSSNNIMIMNDEVKVMYLKDSEWQGVDSEEEAKSLIHKFVPENINEYIFFDGEQLEKYFQEKQRENIQNGIKELTQSSILEKTAKAFDTYITNELRPKLLNSGDNEVESCQKMVDQTQFNVSTQDNVINEIKKQLEKSYSKIEELDSKIHGFEGIAEKRDKFYKLEVESDELQNKRAEKITEMMKFAREYYQYMALYPAMKSIYDYILSQDKNGNLPPVIDKILLAKILNAKHCLICGNDLDDDHVHDVEDLLKSLQVGTATSAELNSCRSALRSFFDTIKRYPEKKKQYIATFNEIKKKIEDNEKEYSKLDEYLRTVPNNEELAASIKERDEYKKTVQSLTEKIGAENVALNTAKEALKKAETKLAKALEENKKLAELNTQIDYCKRAKVILSEIRDEILNECRRDIQSETFEIFKSLLWKKDTFSKVEILEDYTFKLLDKYGEQTLGSSSAGERVLLALSFTLALQKISKHDSLLYIDTPIGRVDTENRINFIDALIKVSQSKQVILTFTPSEYDYNVSNRLNGQYSTFIDLTIDENVTTLNTKNYG
ncbi:AAA family ATPase [Bacteroides thetaiotaomicron]|uniref:AAA family ATPase n=1 Tax=Bacteroides thetaiotaomicron TaxID=818 RepID=UPI0022E93987|nr:AAA family ATPase [Bacteroides thetaiotaomicron]